MNPGGPLPTCRMRARIAPLRPGTAGDDRLLIEAILRPLP